MQKATPDLGLYEIQNTGWKQTLFFYNVFAANDPIPQ
jgi:hypothetical protein